MNCQCNELPICKCGGVPKVSGPCEYKPQSHWTISCNNSHCSTVVGSERDLGDAAEKWLAVSGIHV